MIYDGKIICLEIRLLWKIRYILYVQPFKESKYYWIRLWL